MIICDLTNSLFKWWLRFESFWFNSAVHNKLVKIIVKGCRNFKNMILLWKELWWILDLYFIDKFSIFWEAQCFWFKRNQLFLICFGYWWCCSKKTINSYTICSKIWSDLSNLACSLVLKQSSEDEVS